MKPNRTLKVWWKPQVPCKSFEVEVKSVTEASFLLDVLANYDLFQYGERIKPDYCNMGGLLMWDEEEQTFVDWYFEINAEINGVAEYEYFDEPEQFVTWLESRFLTEEEFYSLTSEVR